MDKIAKILIATSTRADWGLLRPIAEVLRDASWCRLQILATNMHLLPAYGMTVDEISEAGFNVDARVEMDYESDDEASRVHAMAKCLSGTADAMTRLHPDAAIILGDRYEMLAVASAAALMHVPIVHIAGGEISEGAVDDSIRHAITKLSELHLTATELYRRRVIQMGENPCRVINTGAIGVWNTLNQPLMSREELADNLDFDISEPFAVVTYHPATLDKESPRDKCRAMLYALDRYPFLKLIITYPNNDARSQGIIDELRSFSADRPDRVLLVKSLGMRRYLSALQYASVVIGNSSSGIVEVPSMGIPTVDIGIRQRGRIAGPSVLHCGDTSDDIAIAVGKALSPEFQAVAKRKQNPYHRPDTLLKMVSAIKAFADSLPAQPKTFYDCTIGNAQTSPELQPTGFISKNTLRT